MLHHTHAVPPQKIKYPFLLTKYAMDTLSATLLNSQLLRKTLKHTHTHTHTHQSTASLLYGVLTAQMKPTFHKLNVHAAMTPADVWDHLEPVFSQAKLLQEAFKNKVADTFSLGVPFVTVSTLH